MHPLMQSLGIKPRKGDVVRCLECEKEFYRAPNQIIANRKYCCVDCSNAGLVKSNFHYCLVCGTEFTRPMSQEKHRGVGKYCSKPCKGKAMTIQQQGEKNPSWKGGISEPLRRLRASKRFRQWREAVFKRDDYTCQLCNKRGGYLEPDHIKPFAYYPELRFELSNGRTLCKPCHKTTDSYGHKARLNYGGN